MITDAFDKSEVLFGPKDFYGEKKNLCDKCIIVFSECTGRCWDDMSNMLDIMV